MCYEYAKCPFFQRPKANTLPYPRGKTRGAGDTTTLHSLMPAPGFEGRFSTTTLSPYQACGP